ncbi:MAG: hypothetical protein IJP26_06130 [Clostridia bacterium]|nr:hypothetical protein [Clostridia bacterium]
MVKGVNKNIIEINDTGNEIFEKVILYVKPQYNNISNKLLNSETEKILNSFVKKADCDIFLENKKSSKLVVYLFGAALLTVLTVIGFIIF